MATIVIEKATGERYILLGAGFGSYLAKRPSLFFGDLIPSETKGQNAMVCVCNSDGKIGWIDSSQLAVESVDGEDPKQVLGQ